MSHALRWKTKKSPQVLWFVWAADLLFILSGSLAPGPLLNSVPLDIIPLGDKSVHFLAYALFALVPAVAAARTFAVLISTGLMATLGLVLEFGQKWVPGRSFDLADFAANVLGLIAGLSTGFLIRKRRGTVKTVGN